MKRQLQQVCDSLDARFRLPEWPPDPAMSRWVPRVYQGSGFEYTKIFEESFLKQFNGLMLRSSETVSSVFCAAFPSPDVLQRVLDSGVSNSLLFLHHPVDMEAGGAGFLPIPADVIMDLLKKGISIYSCHAPLDCADDVGTNAAIVEALALRIESGFSPYGIGLAGRICTTGPQSLPNFLEMVRRVFRTPKLEIGGHLHAIIERVAVVAGGGDDMEAMKDADSRGCHVYLSGEWYPRARPSDPNMRAKLQKQAEAFMEFSERTNMTLIAVSHTASEHLVMSTQAGRLFAQYDLPVRDLSPAYCWR
jgi:putative NIF3 family GTP cyclohydrolase 1 type 2